MPVAKPGDIIFDQEKHQYIRNGEVYLSVTQLLKKHGLSADYANIPKATLDKAAARGDLIHKEIETYVNTGEIGFTTECEDFADICAKQGIQPLKSEFIVYNDEYKIAGTVDLYGSMTSANNLDIWLGDNKTTSTLHREPLAWQLSIYKFLSEIAATRFFGFHLRPNNKSKLEEVKEVPQSEVFALLEAEKFGEIYKRKQTLEIANQNKIAKLQETIEFYKEAQKKAQAELDKLTAFLVKAMENNNIKTLENELFRVTYVAPSTRATIDSTRLKNEMPDVAKEYSKTSTTKASIRITLRGENASQS